MTKQILNVGTSPNSNTGDKLRTAANKVNNNFNDIYSKLGNGTEILIDLGRNPADYQVLAWSDAAQKVVLTTIPNLVKGDQGERGEQGLTGIMGPVGPKGDTGPVGPVGPAGPSPDTSTYATKNAINTFTAEQIISVNSTGNALRITQEGSGNVLLVEDSANPDSTPFVIDATGKIGIGSSTIAGKSVVIANDMTGSTSSEAILITGIVQSDVTSAYHGIKTEAKVEDELFTLNYIRHFYATQGTIGASSTVDYQIGFFAGSSLSGANSNRAFVGNIAKNAGDYNLDMQGEADNHLAGELGIGVYPIDSPFWSRLYVEGTMTNSTSMAATFGITGTNGVNNLIAVQTDLNTAAGIYSISEATHFLAKGVTLGVGSSVVNEIGFKANGSINQGAYVYGFYGDIDPDAANYNLYMNSAAKNYIGGTTTISVNSTSDALRITQAGSGYALVVEDSATLDSTPFVIDASGNVSIGGVPSGYQFEIFKDGGATSSITSADAGSYLYINRSAGTLNSPTVVTSDTRLGGLIFQGYTGGSFANAASIVAEVDGNAGVGDMPGRLVFSTSGDGTTSPTEKLRIDSSGNLTIASGDLIFSGTGKRIFADFSNGTVTNRLFFQSSSSNSPTYLSIMPTGTSNFSSFQTYNGSDASNSSYGLFGITVSTEVSVSSDRRGTGAYLPLTFYTGGSERVRIDTAGYVTAKGSTATYTPTQSGLNVYYETDTGIGTIGAYSTASATALTFHTGASASTSTEQVRIGANGAVGIGSTAITEYGLRLSKNITGAVTSFGIRADSQVRSDVTTSANIFSSSPSTQATTFTLAALKHYQADLSSLGAGTTLTAQYGFIAENTLIGATTNYGFFSNIAASALTRYNFYAGGTAPNYFSGDVIVFGAGGLGYGTGSGGTVTQVTSRTTGVTINKTNGSITLVSAAGSTAYSTFTVTNSTVVASDVIHVCQRSGTNLYIILVTAVSAGSFNISIATTGGTVTEAPVINFAVMKAVTA